MKIQELRKSLGMSQSEFSRYFEIPIRTIQKWERNESNPPPYIPKLIERVIELEKEKNMDYKDIAITLCDGFLDMPCGCEGCPLYDEDSLDEDGNMVCDLEKLRSERSNKQAE